MRTSGTYSNVAKFFILVIDSIFLARVFLRPDYITKRRLTPRLHRQVDNVRCMISDAKGIEIGKWKLAEHKLPSEFFQKLSREENQEDLGRKSYDILRGWRCDPEEGSRDYVRIRGWEKAEDAGRELNYRPDFVEGGSLIKEQMAGCEESIVKNTQNMEKTD